VVYFPESAGDNFVEIKAYDPVAQANRQNFVRASSLSTKNEDIQSSILLQTAEPLKNEGADKIRREALLESAILDYPDSFLYAEILKLVNPNTQAVFTMPETWGNTNYLVNFWVTGNNVNVRDLPDPVAGKVIGILNTGNEVVSSDTTIKEFVVGGQSAPWVHIVSPFEGWVFGAYLMSSEVYGISE
jgi:hypothetical protein